jgi:predicted HTH domain antitoxin
MNDTTEKKGKIVGESKSKAKVEVAEKETTRKEAEQKVAVEKFVVDIVATEVT